MDFAVEDLFDFNDDLYEEDVVIKGEFNLLIFQYFLQFNIIIFVENNVDSEYFDTTRQVNTIEFTTFFNCNGESSTSDFAANNQEPSILSKDLKSVRHGLNSKLPDDQIELFNFSFDPDSLPIDILIQMTRCNIQRLATSTSDFSGGSNSFYSIRENVTRFMLCLRSQDEIR